MNTGHRHIKLALSQELPPHWLTFIVPEGAVHTAEGGKPTTALPNPSGNYTDPPDKMFPLVNSGTAMMGVTNYNLIGFEAHSS